MAGQGLNPLVRLELKPTSHPKGEPFEEGYDVGAVPSVQERQKPQRLGGAPCVQARGRWEESSLPSMNSAGPAIQ